MLTASISQEPRAPSRRAPKPADRVADVCFGLVLVLALAGSLSVATAPLAAAAQEPSTRATDQTRATGGSARTGFSWDLLFEAGWGTFGFANTLFSEPEEGAEVEVTDRWFEGYIKPGVELGYDFGAGGRLWGRVSAVGERTYGDLPSEIGLAVHSFEVEDLAAGWKSGTAISRWKEDALQFTVGRAPFTVGQGFLLWDGAAEGASRGGYWTNARKAWKMAAVGRFSPNVHAVEAFYLEKNELPDDDSRNRAWGVNYEWSPTETTTLGAMYVRCLANAALASERDGLNVLNLRAFSSPLPTTPDLAFEFEYAREANGDLARSNAWTLKAAYTLSSMPWTPVVSYRYAYFQGDDPGTSRSEAFDPLFLGFSDWGTWWQGEIAGEYFVSNSNLVSHQVRLHLDPTASLGTGLIAYRFYLDRPEAAGPSVISRDVGVELDWYADWTITKRLTLSAVAAFADPGDAVFQISGRTSGLSYGMLYLGYSF